MSTRDQLAHLFGDRAVYDVALRDFTTFRIGGPADALVRVHSIADAQEIASALAELPIPLLVVGQGSNLLVGDEGFRGLVIVLDGDLAAWTRSSPTKPSGSTQLVDEKPLVSAGGAVKLPVLARQTVRAGLGGLEWMVGVPGSIGGAVRMNAGGHGSDVNTNLIHATVLNVRTGALTHRSADDLQLRYRHSNLVEHELVLEATFSCSAIDPEVGDGELSDIVRWRREHQPGGANCGSVFTNPVGDSAGRLIDVAGLRGTSIGTAQVSPKHANFIQAGDNARAADVWALIIHVRRVVFEQFGIVLTPEVRTVGFDATLPELLAVEN